MSHVSEDYRSNLLMYEDSEFLFISLLRLASNSIVETLQVECGRFDHCCFAKFNKWLHILISTK